MIDRKLWVPLRIYVADIGHDRIIALSLPKTDRVAGSARSVGVRSRWAQLSLPVTMNYKYPAVNQRERNRTHFALLRPDRPGTRSVTRFEWRDEFCRMGVLLAKLPATWEWNAPSETAANNCPASARRKPLPIRRKSAGWESVVFCSWIRRGRPGSFAAESVRLSLPSLLPYRHSMKGANEVVDALGRA